MRLPFLIAAFALTFAIGVFALSSSRSAVVAQEPDPCITVGPTEEPTSEATEEPTEEPTATPTGTVTPEATETATEEATEAATEEATEEAEECVEQSGETPIVDPANFPQFNTSRALPPAAPLDSISPAAQAADAAAARSPVQETQPARLPATGSGPVETSSGLTWGAAAAMSLLGVGGVTALLLARRQES